MRLASVRVPGSPEKRLGMAVVAGGPAALGYHAGSYRWSAGAAVKRTNLGRLLLSSLPHLIASCSVFSNRASRWKARECVKRSENEKFGGIVITANLEITNPWLCMFGISVGECATPVAESWGHADYTRGR